MKTTSLGWAGLVVLVAVGCGGEIDGLAGAGAPQGGGAGQTGQAGQAGRAGQAGQGGQVSPVPEGKGGQGAGGSKGGQGPHSLPAMGSGKRVDALPGAGGKPEGTAWDGKGFVVHEWGTNTIVVGSDGSMQRGLHHEEEDLPGFVYDRLKAAKTLGEPSVHPVDVKMETPVTYFYAEKALSAKVSVDFPQGVFTQWYPAVTGFYPPVFKGSSSWDSAEYRDPVLDPKVHFLLPECKAQYSAVGAGLLDWGTVEVLAPGDRPAPPEAPLDQFTWSYARQVEANSVRLAGVEQTERFLFYRGLGNLSLPVQVTAQGGGALTLLNYSKNVDPMGASFVIQVGPDGGAFHSFDGGLAPGQSLSDLAPTPGEARPLDAYVAELGEQVTAALDATGLFHDEAVAMVNTWKRQWFRTPGLRVLYLAPQSFTEQQIPLHVSPAPDATVRVMMIRVEVITPEQEAEDLTWISLFGDAKADPLAAAHFTDLGRFAEPRLRRAIALAAPSPARDKAEALLASLATADTRAVSGE